MNEWIDFKVRIRYSEYSTLADEVFSPGSVDAWMNGKQVAAWRGNIGKNDILGPYFKFGIYKPGKDGFARSAARSAGFPRVASARSRWPGSGRTPSVRC